MAKFSPEHTWVRISRAIASYGGEWNDTLYKLLLAETPACARAIASLHKAGINDLRPYHWCFELCGSFEVTHPNYRPPEGVELDSALVLYTTLCRLFDM